jgi:hypothetical protein
MTEKPVALPTDLARLLGELGPATFVAPSPQPATTQMDIYVSYVPRLRSFSAHRQGLNEVRASSLPELLGRLAELWPDVQFTLHMSKVARAEVAARRNGTPRAEGWH